MALNKSSDTPFTRVEEDKSDNRVVLKYRDPGICVSIINLYCFEEDDMPETFSIDSQRILSRFYENLHIVSDVYFMES